VLRRSRPLHPTEPHRDQALVDHIGANLGLGVVHQLLDLGQERIDQPPTAEPAERGDAGVAAGNIGGDGLGSQPTSCAADQAQRVRSKASRISMISLSGLGRCVGTDTYTAAGRSRGHPPGILVSVSQDPAVRPPGVSRGRSQTADGIWPPARPGRPKRWGCQASVFLSTTVQDRRCSRPASCQGYGRRVASITTKDSVENAEDFYPRTCERHGAPHGLEIVEASRRNVWRSNTAGEGVKRWRPGAEDRPSPSRRCGVYPPDVPTLRQEVDLTYRSSYELALDLAVREPPPDEEVRPGDTA
jgi:hypothetical protein